MTAELIDDAVDLDTLRASLVRYATSLGVDPDIAEDVTQDVMLQAWHRGTGDAPRRPWMFLVTRHRTLDHLKARRRRAEVPLDVNEHDVADDVFESYLAEMDERQAFEIAATAFVQLDPQHRDLLTRYLLDGVPHAQVAREYGISEVAARKRKERAERELRKQFMKLGGTPATFAFAFPVLVGASRSLRRALVPASAAAAAVSVALLIGPSLGLPPAIADQSDQGVEGPVQPSGIGLFHDVDPPQHVVAAAPSSKPPARAAKRQPKSIVEQVIPDCDDVTTWAPSVCRDGHGVQDGDYYVFVDLPVEGQTGYYGTEDVTPLCPVANQLPTVSCGVKHAPHNTPTQQQK